MTALRGSARSLNGVTWRKSVRSGTDGNCVELGRLPGEAGVGIRNSRQPGGWVLVCRREEIIEFLEGIRDGDYDDLL